MIELSGTAYLWVKALHLIAVIAWMAGMLYLPRLFVYHADAAPGTPQSEIFKVMERRLLRGIMNPAMIVAIVLGGVLLIEQAPGIFQQSWIHVKLAAVLGLIVAHMQLAKWRRAFAEDRNQRPQRFFRLINEVPTVFLVVIVVMVVVKPF